MLRSTEHNPTARHTAELVHLVAKDFKAAGWKLKEVTTDNGSEFRAAAFKAALGEHKATAQDQGRGGRTQTAAWSGSS